MGCIYLKGIPGHSLARGGSPCFTDRTATSLPVNGSSPGRAPAPGAAGADQPAVTPPPVPVPMPGADPRLASRPAVPARLGEGSLLGRGAPAPSDGASGRPAAQAARGLSASERGVHLVVK